MRYCVVLLFAFVSACAAPSPNLSGLPAGASAYKIMPAGVAAEAPTDYRIGPLDVIDVNVFQEPDLSQKAIQVDASGRIALPLVGSVDAKGLSASELAQKLERLLGAKYLRDPQVTITVASSVSQKVSVQGEVTQPGVYPLSGPTTLLDVLSLARGETDVASLDKVVIFRTIDGQRMGAVFDVRSIRSGKSADPVIDGNDLVVVGYSAARKFWKNIVSAAPLLTIFHPVL